MQIIGYVLAHDNTGFYRACHRANIHTARMREPCYEDNTGVGF